MLVIFILDIAVTEKFGVLCIVWVNNLLYMIIWFKGCCSS